jgi:hypothetical protein
LYLDWRRRQHHIGCVFARLIASDPDRFLQRVVRVPQASTHARIANNIEKIVEQAISDSVAAVAMTFPYLDKLEDVARVMVALGPLPKWKVVPTKVLPPPAGEYVALNITREIPFGEGVCPSEALVLGPYAEFPPTRRAPVTALEIYVGAPRPRGPLDDADTTKANLAHIELNLPNHATFETMWESSKKGRLDSLGGPDNRAKAKVSLVLPTSMAQLVGCEP